MNQTFQSYPEKVYAWLTHSSISLRLPERKFLFTFVDLIGLNTGVFLAILVSYQLDLTRSEYVVSLADELFQVRGGGSPLIWLVLATAIWLLISAVFGVYDAQVTSDVKYSIIRVGKAVLTTVTLFVLIPYATPFMTSRSVLFTIFLASFLVTLAGRTILYNRTREPTVSSQDFNCRRRVGREDTSTSFMRCAESFLSNCGLC